MNAIQAVRTQEWGAVESGKETIREGQRNMSNDTTGVPIGAVKGPFRFEGATTFMVKRSSSWVPFIQMSWECEADCKRRAEAYAKEITVMESVRWKGQI